MDPDRLQNSSSETSYGAMQVTINVLTKHFSQPVSLFFLCRKQNLRETILELFKVLDLLHSTAALAGGSFGGNIPIALHRPLKTDL